MITRVRGGGEDDYGRRSVGTDRLELVGAFTAPRTTGNTGDVDGRASTRKRRVATTHVKRERSTALEVERHLARRRVVKDQRTRQRGESGHHRHFQ